MIRRPKPTSNPSLVTVRLNDVGVFALVCASLPARNLTHDALRPMHIRRTISLLHRAEGSGAAKPTLKFLHGSRARQWKPVRAVRIKPRLGRMYAGRGLNTKTAPVASK